MLDFTCKCCGQPQGDIFYRVEKTPVNSCLLIDNRQAAIDFPSGSLSLAFCSHCGFIWNAAFDSDLIEYSARYEETQGYSPTFSRFHRQLAKDLVKRFNLNDKRILEIGCGKGEFLQLLCEEGDNTGVGFDPAYVDGRLKPAAATRLTFIKDFYSEKFADYKADFICCKMTLEHINEPRHFLQTVRKAIGHSPETIIFFQVPDAGNAIKDAALEDFYYEHCSYFTRTSLERLFHYCGFTVKSIESVYDQQYLIIEARLAEATTDAPMIDAEIESLKSAVDSFCTRCEMNLRFWNTCLAEWSRATHKVVVWGAGSKATGFLTALNDPSHIEYIVDINPNKTGTFAAGTGQEIVSPDFLAKYRPHDVIIMNAIYKNEIAEQLKSLGIKPRLHTLRNNVGDERPE